MKFSKFWCEVFSRFLGFSVVLHWFFWKSLKNAEKCRLCRQNRRRYSRYFSVLSVKWILVFWLYFGTLAPCKFKRKTQTFCTKIEHPVCRWRSSMRLLGERSSACSAQGTGSNSKCIPVTRGALSSRKPSRRSCDWSLSWRASPSWGEFGSPAAKCTASPPEPLRS